MKQRFSGGWIRSTTLLALVLGSYFGLDLSAADKTWTGAVSDSWANGGNWSPEPLLPDFDSVVYDGSSGANPVQLLEQNWSIAGLRVLDAPGPITILPGSGSFVLTNNGGIDMSAATADLAILADYHPLNNGSLNVAAGRTLTLSNILANINSSSGATVGGGTVRILGSARRLTDTLNSVSVIVDGGSVAANVPFQLGADPNTTVTVLVTNNGSVSLNSGNGTRIKLGHLASPSSTNHFIVDGGTVSITGSGSSTANGILVGDATGTTGIFDIRNGTVNLTHRNANNALSLLRIGNDAGSEGVVTLGPGGILRAPRIDAGSGAAFFNFDGGVFVPDQLGTFFAGVQEIQLLSGGGTIDTGNSTNRVVTVAAPVVGPGGLTKLGVGSVILGGTNNYAGPTVLTNGQLGITLPMSSSALTLGSNASLAVNVGALSNATWAASTITMEGSNTLTFSYNTDSQPSETLLSAGLLSATGSTVVNIFGSGWPSGTTRLIDYDGVINGSGTFVLGPLPVGLNARLTNNPVTTSIDLVVSTAVNNVDWSGFSGAGVTGGGLWDIATTLNWNNGASTYNEYGAGQNRLGDSVRFAPTGNTLVEVSTTVRPSAVTITNLTSAPYFFVGSGKISGPTSVIKEGNGGTSLVSFANTNDYTGGTFIRIGTIRIDTQNALPIDGLVFLGSPGNGAFLTLNGYNQTIAGLISAGSGSGNRRVINANATAGTITFNVPDGTNYNYTHTMGNNGAASDHIDNNFAVVKSGAGVQGIANSYYNGTTTISAGTLLFNGAAGAVTNIVTVQSSGIVGGTGTVGAPVNVLAGGRIEPGNLGIGTLTVTNTVTLQGETVMQLSRGAVPNADKLVGTQINFGGILIVTNVGIDLQNADTFQLFSGGLSGSFHSVVLPPLPAGLKWNTGSLATSGTISVETVAMPTFSGYSISNGELVLSGSGGAPNAIYHILGSTNAGAPLVSWTPVATNSFDSSGSFNVTIPASNSLPEQFYLLELP